MKTWIPFIAIVFFLHTAPAANAQQPKPPLSPTIKNLHRELEVVRIQIDNLQKREKALLKRLEDAKAQLQKRHDQYIHVKMRGELQSVLDANNPKEASWRLRVQRRTWKLDIRKLKKTKADEKLLVQGQAVIVHGYLHDRRVPEVGVFAGASRESVVVVTKIELAEKNPKKIP